MNLAGIEFSERDLIARVMNNMRRRQNVPTPRWAVVKDTFGVGSTVAKALCLEFNMDPEEYLK